MVSAPPARRSLLRPILWIVAGLVVACVIIVAMGITKAAEEGVRNGVARNLGHDEDIKSIQSVVKQDSVLADAPSISGRLRRSN